MTSFCSVSRPASRTAFDESSGQRPFVASGQTNQTFGKLLKITKQCGAFRFASLAQLESRRELAKVLISGLRFTEQRDTRRFDAELMRQPLWRRKPWTEAGDGNLRTHMRLQSGTLRRRMKTCRAVDSVTIRQGQRVHPQFESLVRSGLPAVMLLPES